MSVEFRPLSTWTQSAQVCWVVFLEALGILVLQFFVTVAILSYSPFDFTIKVQYIILQYILMVSSPLAIVQLLYCIPLCKCNAGPACTSSTTLRWWHTIFKDLAGHTHIPVHVFFRSQLWLAHRSAFHWFTVMWIDKQSVLLLALSYWGRLLCTPEKGRKLHQLDIHRCVSVGCT